nr:hypothetical protein [Candidatus Dojkabacteria bacterium]
VSYLVINITRAGGDTQSLDANIEVLTVDGSGTILTVDIIDGGEYSITPTAFTITTGSGAGADLTFELAPCPTYNGIGTDCDSNTVDLPVGIPVGTTFATCLVGGYTPEPAGYVITQTGCCVAADSSSDVCFDYHLENTTGFGIDVRITHCDGMFELITVPALTIEAMCLISGGVAEPLSPGLIITNTGTPCP